jgi:tetratricopeptide (TPR) repeat protein
VKIFGKKRAAAADNTDQKELTIEDLVTLERYEEAAVKLKARLKVVPKDLHAHLKLAEVYLGLKNLDKALAEYTFVADSFADDGFFDKGIALLGKAAKLAPGDDTLPKRIERYKRVKRLEERRRLVIEGLMANKSTVVAAAANRALEVEMMWPSIARSHLVEQLEGEKLKKLFSVMGMRRTKEGEVVAEEGSSHQMLYLVVNGEIEALAAVGSQHFNIRSFSTGDVIGESTLLERKPWPARYQVKESGTVFELSREGLQQAMIGNDDPVGFLSVLRQQNNDRDVAANLHRLRAT